VAIVNDQQGPWRERVSNDSLKPLELAVKIREELLRIRQEKSCEGESLLRLDIGSPG